MKKSKKALSLFLSVLMVLLCFPIVPLTASAADLTDLQQAITEANALDSNSYVNFSGVAAAVNAAAETDGKTGEQIADMAAAIRLAIAKLELKLKNVPAGFTAISTPQQFSNIRYNLSGKYILLNDLDFSNFGNLSPINGFSGTLNGNGFCLNGVTISIGNANYGGIFQTTNNATFENLGIENSNIYCDCNSGRNYTGSLVGNPVNTVISNCYVMGTRVQGRCDTNDSYTGGLVGAPQNTTLRDCFVHNSNISSRSNGDAQWLYAGGLVGHTWEGTEITRCYVSDCNITYVGNASAYHAYRCSAAGRGGNGSLNYFYSNWSRNDAEGGYSGENAIPSIVGSAMGLTQAQLATQSTYQTYDFTNVWQMGYGDYNYPMQRVFTVDRAELVDAINTEIHPKSAYTESSYNAYLTALESVVAVLNKAVATQAEIDSATTVMNAALSALYVVLTVHFDTAGGEPIDDVTVVESDSFVLPTPIRAGYTFLGWHLNDAFEFFGTPGDTILFTSIFPNDEVWDATLTAQWALNTSNLTLDTAGGYFPVSTQQTVFEGKHYLFTLEIPAPKKDGYTFAGWVLSGQDGAEANGTYNTNTRIYTFGPTADATDVLTAQWTENTSTLRVNPNGGTWSHEDFVYDEGMGYYDVTKGYNSYVSIPDPTREGYTFTGWELSNISGGYGSTNGNFNSANKSYWFGKENNAVDLLEAQWEVNEYTIRFYSDETKTELLGKQENVAHGETVEFVGATPTKTVTGYTYTFIGWKNAETEEFLTAETTATGNASYYAVFEEAINTYTVTLPEAVEGVVSFTGAGTYDFGETVTITAELNKHYTFDGWYENGEKLNELLSFSFAIGADRNLEAHYSLNTYNVKFVNYDFTPLCSMNIEGGEAAQFTYALPEKLSDASGAYEFDKWAVVVGDDSEIEFSADGKTVTGIGSDVTLIATYKLSEETYTVTYKANDIVVKTVEDVAYNANVSEIFDGTAPADYTAGGKIYTFNGWDKAVVRSDMTVNAIFVEKDSTVYRVSFEDEAGTTILICFVPENSIVPPQAVPAAPAKAGSQGKSYIFTGWQAVGSEQGVTANITEDTTFKPVYAETDCDHANATSSVVEADCTQDGSTVYECECGFTWTVVTEPALGHSFGEFASNGDGTHSKDCSRCDETETAYCSGGEATCTDKAVCEVCGEEYGEALGHDYELIDTVPAQCEVEGSKTFKCSRCDDEKVEEIEALEHNYGEAWTTDGESHWHECSLCHGKKDEAAHSGGEANCATEAVCEICEASYGGFNEVHDFSVQQNTVAPTCQAGGYTVYKCSRCEVTTQLDPTEQLDHEYIFNASNSDGTHTLKCKNGCNDVKTEDCAYGAYTSDGTNHSHTCTVCNYTETGACASETSVATCVKKAVCDICGNNFGDFGEHGETAVRNEKAPNCVETGYTGDTYCTLCGETLSAGEEIPALTGEHTWVAYPEHDAEATCGHGTRTNSKICSVCETVVCDEADDKLEHNPESFVVLQEAVAATCTSVGYTAEVKCDDCGTIVSARELVAIDPEAHDYVLIDTIPANCGCATTENYKCSYCNAPKTVYTGEKDMNNHVGSTHIDTSNAVEATCGTAGYEGDVICDTCGEFKQMGATIPATGNHNIVEVPAVAPTCTAPGKTAGAVCDVCGYVQTPQTNIQKLGHTPKAPVEENRVESTCTVKGHYDEVTYCDTCGDELLRETINLDLASHTPGEAAEENVVPATCSELGHYDLVVRCTECDAVISSEEKTIDKTPHTEVIDEMIPSTCTTAGKSQGSHCDVCGEVIVAQTDLPLAAHNESRTVHTDANCTAVEYSKFECLVCHNTREVYGTSRNLNNHIGETELVGALDATCCADGYTGDLMCLACNNPITIGQVIPMDVTLHNFVANGEATPATCCTFSETPVKCSNCGEEKVIVGTEYDANNHSDYYTRTEGRVSATCCDEGFTGNIVCLNCGNVKTYGTTTPATGLHNYRAEITAPTCTEQGYTTYRCTVCDASYVTDTVRATGHSFGQWHTTTEPNACITNGVQTRECQVCGHSETRIYSIAHTPSESDPNTCSVCGKNIGGSGSDPSQPDDDDHNHGTPGSCGCCDEHSHDKSSFIGWIQCFVCKLTQFIRGIILSFKNIGKIKA